MIRALENLKNYYVILLILAMTIHSVEVLRDKKSADCSGSSNVIICKIRVNVTIDAGTPERERTIIPKLMEDLVFNKQINNHFEQVLDADVVDRDYPYATRIECQSDCTMLGPQNPVSPGEARWRSTGKSTEVFAEITDKDSNVTQSDNKTISCVESSGSLRPNR